MQQYGGGQLSLPQWKCPALWGVCNQGSSSRGMPRRQGSRKPSGGPEIAHEGVAALSTQSLPPAPTELPELQDGSTNCPWTPSRWSAFTRIEPLLPSSKKSQTKRRSPTTVTNEVHCPQPVTKLCHLPVTRQGSGLRDLGRRETYLLNT